MIDSSKKLRRALSVLMVASLMVTGLFVAAVGVTAADGGATLGQEAPGAGTVPTAPRNLVVDQGPGFNWLWWDHPATQGTELIKYYQIWRGTSSGGEALIDTIQVGNTSFNGAWMGGLNIYNDTSVELDTTYWYKIKAVSDVGASAFSNEVEATPSLIGDAPGAPGVTAENLVYGAQVNWTAPADEGSTPVRFYFVEKEPGMYISWLDMWINENWDWLTEMGLDDNPMLYLEVGRQYNYTVWAVNTYGRGAPGLAEVVVGGTGLVPSAPTSIWAFGANHSAMVWWGPPTNPSSVGFTRYDVYRADAEVGPYVLVGTYDYAMLYLGGMYIDEGLTNGQTYYYKVKAVNGNGASAFSDVASAVPMGEVNLMGVSHLDAYPGNGKVYLDWYGNYTNITGWKIYRSETPGAEVFLADTGGTASEYMDETAVNGHTYYYVVRAVRDSTLGPASPEDSATPSTGTLPAAPYLAATPDNTGVMLYSPPTTDIGLDSPILGWRIYRGTTPGGQGGVPIRTIEDTTFDDELEWTDTTALDDVNYYYTIQVENMFGLSPMSNEATSFASAHGDVPDPVTTIQAVGGTGQITVSWDSPAYQGTAIILDYDLERSSATENWHTILWDFEDFVGTSDYTDKGVTPGVTYSYRVMVSNQYGEASGYSPTASAAATSATSAPSAPRSLVAQSGIGQVVLNWLEPTSQGSSAITGYKIFRGTTSGGQGATPIGTTPAGTLTYTDTVAAGFYYYVVKAVNAVGDSPASNEADGTSVAAQPPGAPTNLAAVGHNGYVILTWDAPTSSGSSSVTRYDVFRGTTAGGIGATPIGNVAAGTLTYNDTAVTNGQAYFYQVKAVNAEGSSPASNTASATPTGPSPPSAPLNLVAAGHDGYVILTWDAPASEGTSPIQVYPVYRSTTSGVLGDNIQNVGPSTRTFNDTGVTNGVTYYYTVKAANSVGAGPGSVQAPATPSETGTAPGAPQSLDAVGQVGSIALTWEAPANVGSGVTSYLVFRATASNGQGDTPMATVSGGTLTYTDSSAVVGTPYFYKVKASNSFGTSAFSNEDSATATEQPSGTPSYPQNLAASPGEGKVTLTWQAPADDGGSPVTGYKVYRQLGSGSPVLLATLGASTLTYEDTSGTAGTTYTYWVVATNANGSGAESAEVNAAANEPSDGGGGLDTNMLLIIGGILVAVVLAAVIVLARRKK